MIGEKFAHYEITSHLGSGGMGEVYQATDSKLGRSVALKFLPAAFADDLDRVARFEREARVLASLNHPNIAGIYGLEHAGGKKFLVMELVSGETLAERIARGPLAADEALGIAKGICDAVEAAHERGIVHRDLKPANVKITPDSTVKVLDFGLAKDLATGPAASAASNSPTVNMSATHPGVIIGTAAYMSPEQARGRNADHRSDVFSLGCILYEMLAGRQAFSGDDASEILAAVIKSEPDRAALPANLDPRVRGLLDRCLEKNPKRRWQAIGDVRIEIENVLANPAAEEAQRAPAAVAIGNRRREWILGVAALVAMAALVVSLVLWAPWRVASPAEPMRLNVELGADAGMSAATVAFSSALAISPDGNTLVFGAEKNGGTQLYVRRLGQLQALPLSGTSAASSPFFSPDGQWVAFFADGKLKTISITGGAAVALADAPNGRGGNWGDDGNIVFTPDSGTNAALMRVPSAGGTAAPLTKLAQGDLVHRWPFVLPGAKGVLYTAHTAATGFETANIVLQPLPSGTPKILIRGGYHAQYVASGHIVYIHEGTLFAAPFDLNRMEITGTAVPAVEGVLAQPGNGAAEFDVSKNGSLVYLPGKSVNAETPILWMTRDGKTKLLRPASSNWSNPHFSPDGRKLAVDIIAGNNADVWVYEWSRDSLTRLTFDPGDDRKPIWAPDGKRIVFASSRMGILNLYWQNADGTGEVQRLTESSNVQIPGSFHPGGKYIAFQEQPRGDYDLMILPIEGDEKSGWKPGKPSAFLSTPANEQEPMFSPDGRWIAYTSNESGRNEVFVRPFPGPGGKWQISTGGGGEATWSQRRHELLYRTPDQHIMVASYTVEGDSFKADKPRPWSEQPVVALPRQRVFDLHPDGDRIAASVSSGQTENKTDNATFVFNFFDELRRIAPISKK
jgi:serine/threonine-protein kinase